jgi:hypothetical protein
VRSPDDATGHRTLPRLHKNGEREEADLTRGLGRRCVARVWPAVKDNSGNNFSVTDNLFGVKLSGVARGKAM